MKSGSLLNLDKSCSPLSVFEAIFDAATFRSNKPLQPTELLGPTWENVTVPEMKSFIGILIAMEIHRLPAVNDYWNMDPLLGDPGITKGMSRDRFKSILRYLHLNDNTKMPSTQFRQTL